jgi:hypothetical protein
MNVQATRAFVVAMVTGRWLLLTLVALTSPAVEHRQPNGYSDFAFGEELELPTSLATTLEAPVSPILLGAGWVVDYVIHNRGLELIHWMSGGDYRAPRPVRVWLEAVDPEGRLAVDPLGHRPVWCMGGMGGQVSIDPLGSSAISVNPLHYVRIDRPGRWTLRMFHDLGMGPPRGDDDPRWASTTVEMIMPDEAQARAVLDEHDRRLGVDHGWRAGQRHSPPAYHAAMAFPIYLPLLRAKVLAGSRAAIAGLADMPTAEAADCLLDLLTRPPAPLPAIESKHFERRVSHPWVLALQALEERLTPPAEDQSWRGTGDPRLVASIDEQRRQLVTKAALLKADVPDKAVRDAAEQVLTRCRLTPDIAIRLLAAALPQAQSIHDLQPLLSMARHGNAPATPSGTPAELVVWLDHLISHPQVRPDGWDVVLTSALAHPHAVVRTLALGLIPADGGQRWSKSVRESLTNDQDDVRLAGIDAAGRTRDASTLPVLRTITVDREVSAAAGAIGRIAGIVAECDYLLTRFESSAETSAISTAFGTLLSRLTGCGHSGGWDEHDRTPAARAALATRWRAFLAQHRDAVANGKPPPVPTWPRDLMPSRWHIQLPDGSEWPERGR